MGSTFQGNTVFNNGGSPDINNWRPISCSSFYRMFFQAYAFNQPIGNWLISASNISMAEMFYQASSFNQNMGAWDVSKVTAMNQMFFSATAFNNSGSNSIRDWRPISCSNFNGMFQNCSAFNQPINWPLSASNVTMGGMFNSCVINQPLTWDTRNVTNMGSMFAYAGQFNQNIGAWNVEKVTSMGSMFLFAGAFNNSGSSDINNWRPISCSNFSSMFQSATTFNQPIGNWPLSASNINMAGMFLGSSFNQDISTWDTSRVINMNSMFRGASSFNQPIENWDVSNVVDMTNMFYDPINFSRPIGIWNVGNVTSMNRMFYNNSSVTRPFNENIGAWNVSKVTNFADMFRISKFNNSGSSDINNWTPVSCSNFNGMFQSATVFNQPVEGWTLPTDRTYTMQDMFSGATSFNQPLGNWNIVSCSNMSGMLNSCGMDINNYSQTLIGWASQPDPLIPRNITLGATGRQYTTPGSASRAILIADYNWTITGDTYVPL
jgi:surface protein